MFLLLELIIKFLFSLLFLTSLLLATQHQIHLTPSQKKWLIDNPTLYVGADSNWKPIEFKSKDKTVGYSVDLLNSIAKIIGVDIKYVDIKSFEQLQEMVINKEVVMFSALIKTDNRMKYLRFSDYYLILDTSICTLKKKKVDNLHQLKSKRVAIVKGYAISEFIKKDYPYINLIEVNTTKEALSLLEDSKADAYLDATQTLKFYLEDNNYENLILTDTPSYKLELSFAVDKNEKVLLEILQKVLYTIQEHEKESLIQKWFQVDRYENKHFIIKLFILFGLLTVFVYIYILKNEKYR